MAVETVTREGDYVLKGQGRALLRLHMNEGEMIITSDDYRGMHTIASLSDVRELRDWLTRRLEEPIN